MTDPKCRDCGSELVVWGKTKAGKPVLMELRPHFIYCKKRQKRVNGPQDEAVDFLMGLKYKKREAVEMLRGVPAGKVEDIVREALKRKGDV